MQYYPLSMSRFSDTVLLKQLFHRIPAEDVVAQQRFILFRIFSYTGPLVCLGVFIKMQLTIANAGILPWYILILGGVILLNYALAPLINNVKTSYILLLSSACALLHIVAYSCGGIQTAGTFYFSAIILYAYMLLGRKGGMLFTGFAFLHVIYLYIVTEYTDVTSFSMFKYDHTLISQDFLTNAILTFFLIASHSNYLQSHKNVIIQGLEQSNAELKKKNLLLKDYAANLKKSNSELEKFAYVASHDLKAPLRSIGSISGIIMQDAAERMDDDTKQNLQLISQRVNRMEKLINGLLEYSKINRQDITEHEVHFDELVNELIREVNPSEKITVSVNHGFSKLRTDRIKLKAVLSSLITNAIRHNNKPDREVILTANDHQDEWQFSVRDNGQGIDKKFHEKIFVIFQTLKARDEQESMGLGLSISKKIIEDMGGRIWVNSEPGQGADFIFTIPKERPVRADDLLV